MSTYTDLAGALARTKERSGASGADDALLTELLNMSAGTAADSTTHYRPFYVAATWMEQNQSAQQLLEADGAKFTGLAKPIASLLRLQAAYDRANGLTIPEGFEAVTDAQTNKRYTRSHAPKILP